MSKTLITSYKNPDLDGFACAVAYGELLGAEVGIFGQPSLEVEFLLDKYSINRPSEKKISDYEEIILVDASDVRGVKEEIDPEKVIEIIDHRQVNEAEVFINAKKQIEMVGAAATLVAERFEGKKISKESAILLYGAIISNTLNFQSGTTTERDRKMAEWLKKEADIEDNFAREMFLAKSKLDLSILSQFDFSGKKVGILQLEVIDSEEMISNKKEWVLDELKRLKEKNDLDLIFLTVIDLEKGFNLFVAIDEEIKNILHDIFGVEFNNNIAKKQGVIMRKEIVPLLKENI